MKPGEIITCSFPEEYPINMTMFNPSMDSPASDAEAATFMAFWKGTVEWRYAKGSEEEYESAVTVTLDRAPVSATAPTFLLAAQAASLVVRGAEER